MRTTLDLPTGLVEEARDAIGFKSKTDTVVFALKEVVRRSRVDDLKALVRRIDFEFDPTKLRELDREAPVIVVDTSVWIGARRDAAIARTLDSLLDADEVALALPVRLELWAGTAGKDRPAFDAAFSALAQVIPDDDTWRRMTHAIARAADAGEHFAFVDMLIGVLATDTGALVWSLDSDFERMERLGLVSRFDPPLG